MLWENSLFFTSPLPACGKQPCNLRVYPMDTMLVKPQFSARRESFQQTLRSCGMSAEGERGGGLRPEKHRLPYEGRRFLTAHRSAAMGTWPPLAGEVGERERTRKGDAALSRPCAPPLRPFGAPPLAGEAKTGDTPFSPNAGDGIKGQRTPVYTRAAQGIHPSHRTQGTISKGNERLFTPALHRGHTFVPSSRGRYQRPIHAC